MQETRTFHSVARGSSETRIYITDSLVWTHSAAWSYVISHRKLWEGRLETKITNIYIWATLEHSSISNSATKYNDSLESVLQILIFKISTDVSNMN